MFFGRVPMNNEEQEEIIKKKKNSFQMNLFQK